MTDFHFAKFDAEAKTLRFTCTGDTTAECHRYPDCECERWLCDHPMVPHSECWLKDWFDMGLAEYTGPDEDRDESDPYATALMPLHSHEGPIVFDFDDAVSWEWADGGPSLDD